MCCTWNNIKDTFWDLATFTNNWYLPDLGYIDKKMKTLRDILQSHHIMITTLTTYAHMCHYGRNLNILAKNYDALNAWRTKIDFSPLWLIPPILNFKKFRKSGWRLESGIGPWVCIYGQKNPTIIGHYSQVHNKRVGWKNCE